MQSQDPNGALTPTENTSKPSEGRKSRRRREREMKQTEEAPLNPGAASSSSAPQNRANDKMVDVKTFEAGLDFIPFDFPAEEEKEEGSSSGAVKRDNSPGPSGRDKGKGKEKEVLPLEGDSAAKERVRDGTRPRSRDGERTSGRERDAKRARSRDRERSGRRDKEEELERDGERRRDRQKDRERDKYRDRDRDGERRRGGEHDDRRNGKRKREGSYDPNDGYTNKKQRMDASSRKCPWVAGLDWDRCHHVAEMLHREVEAFTNWISPTSVEDEVRGLVVALITRAVTNAFPDASVIPFGSYETKLYLPLGDVDLVILSESMAYSDKITVLHALANTLRRSGITNRVTIIAKAKVPIVKFITTHGRFNVDISINQENGVVSGGIINGFLQDMHGDPGGKGSLALRSLVMITKAFLSQRSMNEVFTGGLGSYSIVCLAISFLQMHPKIRRGEIDAEKNLGVLVMEFFELYGCYFNYEEVGISVRDGGTYFSKKQRGWHDYSKSGLLSIEDPADPSNDISRGSYGFQKVRATFAGAHGILTSTAYLHAGILASRREGRSVRLRGYDDPADMSILSSVMGVTQETINHRKLVQELYDKRTLHNLLGIKPQPVAVESVTKMTRESSGRKERPSSTLREANSVRSAWEEAEMHPDDDDDHYHHKRRREYQDEEEGRYDISWKRPPRKRRRARRPEDAPTVYISDDEEDSTRAYSLDSEMEEVHYVSDEDDVQPEKLQKVVQRRSYWLSKGIGMEDT